MCCEPPVDGGGDAEAGGSDAEAGGGDAEAAGGGAHLVQLSAAVPTLESKLVETCPSREVVHVAAATTWKTTE